MWPFKKNKTYYLKHVLKPQGDITAYEVAVLMANIGSGEAEIDDLPKAVKRHIIKQRVCWETGHVEEI